MRKSRRRRRSFGFVVVLGTGLLLGAADHALASPVIGTIVASGDTNIANALTGDDTTVDTGNQQFFQNLLGSGHTVLIAGQAGDPGITSSNSDVNTYYNSIAGVTSSIASGDITAGDLLGVDLFVSLGRSVGYTSEELTALSGFHSAGHTILVAGDATNFSGENTVAAQLLSGLGSSLSLVPDAQDPLYHTATGSRIISNPLTNSVTSFTYAYVSTISGGFPLFNATSGQTFLASSVPEPSSLAILVVGGCFLHRRSRAA